MFRSRKVFSLAIALTILAGPLAHAKVATVILISIDGLSASLFNEVPHDRLLITRPGDGTDPSVQLAAHALTILPPLTLPAHASMLSGVAAEQHHVLKDEHDLDLRKIGVPTLFDLVKANHLTSASIVGKEKLAYLLDTGAATWTWDPSFFLIGDAPARFPSVVTYEATNLIEAHKPNFVFLHYAAVDTIGHAFGWGGFAQRLAARRVFAAIDLLLNELRIDLAGSSYAVIITADHGGHGTAHGQTKANGELEDPHDLEIPWLLIGAHLRSPNATVHLTDTAPTIAHLLGLEVPAAWHWTGANVAE